MEAPIALSKGCCLEAHSNLLSLLPKSPFYCLRSNGFQGEDGFYILRKYSLKGQRIAFVLVSFPLLNLQARGRVGRLICLFFPSAPLSYPPHPQAVSVPLPKERPLSSSTSMTSRARTKQWCNEASRKQRHPCWLELIGIYPADSIVLACPLTELPSVSQ